MLRSTEMFLQRTVIARVVRIHEAVGKFFNAALGRGRRVKAKLIRRAGPLLVAGETSLRIQLGVGIIISGGSFDEDPRSPAAGRTRKI